MQGMGLVQIRKPTKGLKRSYLPRSRKALKRKTRIKKVSTRQKGRMAKYYEIRRRYLEENPRCEICLHPATEIHHVKSRRGNLLFDTKYFMAVDRPCHTRIHENVQWAKTQGFLVPFWK